ncbi:DNA-binding XRE family transcriptional regulator [Ruminiclostridium sufflavum DSM 19573]|uniref:DNA-binding XRE family transcriptional regulator n=1 Tax=Ruminiclostridium sufflavum DSM 19573 TaxID=1121337 RepID=A0A318XJB9_9FIRM|nr:helix-turn-helix transcriptional regulator [Ruminiclostridium sufflavum]PYG84262.1 DNA-binding XRE family transcriptional regulator [Ruminiclostridium sufflavum DSM 19573]
MNRVRALRIEKNWTQEELGKRLNVKKSAVSKYEGNKIPLTDETLIRLSQIFNVSIDYILKISDYRHSTPIASKSDLLESITALSTESQKELEKYVQLLKLKDSTSTVKNS